MTQRLSSVERREQIIHAALNIISERGFVNLTTAGIAARVGITEGAIFKHFNTKTDILREMLLFIRNNIVLTGDRIASEEIPATAKLEKLLRVKFEFFSKYPGVPKTVFAEQVHLSDEGLRDILLVTVKSYSTIIKNIIIQGITEGAFRKDIDPELATEAFTGLVQVTVFKWSLSGHSWDLVRRADDIIAYYLKTITAQG